MNYVELAIPFFIVAMAAEYIYGLIRGKQTYRLNDTVNSLSLGVLSSLVDVLKLSFSAAVFSALVSWLGITQWPMDTIWEWVFAFIAYDFCYYWKHRCGHESRLFWASHVAHHQSEEYNLSTALRQTATDYIGFVFYLPLFLLGVPPLVVVTVGSLNLIYQFWVHTEHVRRLGPLEWFLVTPSNHRVHHARNPIYLDKNYGGVFILWDRIFGSFQAELDREPCIYGTVHPLASWNPLWANFHIWFEILRISVNTRRISDKVRAWYKAPGWYPEDLSANEEPDSALPKYNPPVQKSIKIYAFLNFWFITFTSLWLLQVYNDLPRFLVLLLFTWMTFSLYLIGLGLEGGKSWYRLEGVKIIFSLLLTLVIYLMWSQYLSNWGLLLAASAVFNLVQMLLIYNWADKTQREGRLSHPETS